MLSIVTIMIPASMSTLTRAAIVMIVENMSTTGMTASTDVKERKRNAEDFGTMTTMTGDYSLD